MIQPRAMAVRLGLIGGTVAACMILLAGCGGSSGPATYTVRASVSGLSGSGLILQLNAGNDLAVTANGNFTFAMPVTAGMVYYVTVKTQPSSPQQVCTVGNGSGTISTGNATVTISCATTMHTIGVSVSGLSGTGLALHLNGGNDLAVPANGKFMFATPVTSGTAYHVTVKTQPSSPQQVCTVANGSGTISTGNATVTISCATVHTVGVSVSGLSGTGLVLQLNGGNDLPIVANGTATFSGAIDSGATYTVAVGTQPTFPAQMCSVANSSGTVGTANVSGITITCVTSIAILHSFTGGGGVAGSIDGAGPNGSLVQGSDGSLYGTTLSGGASINVASTVGSGTVFKITLSGQEMVLHSFGVTVGDGASPVVGLTLGSDGNFYGPTPYSTDRITGTLYQISADGAESVIYPFPLVDGVDDFPMLSGVIQGSNGLLYGADYEAGSTYRYVIYGITTTGMRALTIDIGANLSRQTNLVQASEGSLYGTTNGGGTYGMGTVFKAKPDVGTIYSFGGIAGDALAPGSPMIQGHDGNLYGTTATGGSPSATCPHGCGTVFRVTPSGVETVLYSFGSSSADGQGPSGSLVQASDGNFYGTTAAGGSTASSRSANSNCASANVYSGYSGCGTIYKITPTGIATVLYSFGSTPEDGTVPTGALLQARDGNLYGTTTTGGAANEGTVFKLVLGAN